MMLSHIPILRLVQSRLAWLTAIGWSGLVFASAFLQRRHASAHGADHAVDMYGAIAVPLIAYALVSVAVGQNSLARSGRPLVMLGAPRARVALETVLVTMLASALVSGVLGAAAVACAHGSADPPLVEDALHTLEFGAVAAAAYAAYFMVGAALVASFWGRAFLLLVDWILGSDVGFGALLTPRAHLRNLLGGEAPFDAAPWESLLLLVTIAALCATFSVRRAARTRL
jgi:hypothetical protein